MNLKFDTSLAEGYKSPSQIARVLTEDWLARNMYCPICGEVDELQLNYPNNNHIPDKIRQQLQFLRDKGIIEFKGHGVYKKI